MMKTLLLILGVVSFAKCSNDGIREQPLVAFKCSKPAMYLGPDGWVIDRSTDCLVQPEKILAFCKKVYPDKIISNVVEAPTTVKVSEWCDFDGEYCKEERVRPFRCLEGVFQSDALLVPQHCLFDHKHGSLCSRWYYWNTTAEQACTKEHGMHLDSFAVLQPCGIGVFTGVEFVCCPSEKPVELTPVLEDNYAHEDVIYPENIVPVVKEEKKEEKVDDENNFIMEEIPVPEPKKKNKDTFSFQTYLQGDENGYDNEHQTFVKAKNNLVKHHHDKVTKMMKEWAEAREQVQKMRHVDPKAAEKLHKEISTRFQKTYQALEQEGQLEKEQVLAIHQQRVQAKLNQRKQTAMEGYIAELSSDEPNEKRVEKKLMQYVKAEEKDRQHSINHLIHIQETKGEEEASVERAQTLQHLDVVDERIKSAVAMLGKAPLLKEKIASRMEKFIASFKDLDEEVAVIRETPVKEEEEPPKEEVVKKVIPLTQAYRKDAYYEEEDFSKDNKDSKQEEEKQEKMKFDYIDDEVQEDEYAKDNIMAADHAVDSRMELEFNDHPQNLKSKGSDKMTYSTLATSIIAIAAVCVFVIILAGVVVIKRRSSRGGHPPTVQIATSPEEKHVANMQMNGYENPTYRYFEMNAQA